jgi:hypothetical protein
VADTYLPSPGQPAALAALTIPKARQLAEHLKAETHPWARLVETTRTQDTDDVNTVVFDVDVEVSQERINDIHDVERVAVSFRASDANWPQVLALRADFPFVPHLFLREDEFPRSLCLYEDSYAEQKMRWTAISIIERVREWLRDTAAGTLHAGDQPLEPIFLGLRAVLILPHDTFSVDAAVPPRLNIVRFEPGECGEVFVAARPTTASGDREAGFIAITLLCPPIVHGAIRVVPKSLLELHRFSVQAGLDLFDELRQHMREWLGDTSAMNCRLLIVLGFPKVRRTGSSVETTDVWGFVTNDVVTRIGETLGLWQMQGAVPGVLLGGRPDEDLASTVGLLPLNSMFTLSRAMAAAVNGFEPECRRITAVGLGALGSQLTATLVRAGYGRWTFLDGDLLLPHNVARHELYHMAVGRPKAAVMKMAADGILAESSVDGFAIVDVLNPGNQAETVATSFAQADAITDFSASLAVSRHLARDVPSPARRLAAFLNPRGSDLVVFAEDAGRKITLDCLEMQYYREILVNPDLADHLKPPDGRVRYARSCRDVSSTVPEDQVAMHAAIGARAVRTALARDAAGIDIWTSTPDLSTKRVHIQPVGIVTCQLGEFDLVTDERFTAMVRQLRGEKLPRETGGVLLGCWDLTRKLVYVVHTIISPPDSKERSCLYIRGVAGLREAVELAKARTGHMLQYLGEWHSHPDGYGAAPSKDDYNVWAWVKEKTQEDGYPPVMLIAGERDLTWFVGSVAKSTSGVEDRNGGV